MDAASTQTASEGGSAVAADSDHTQAAANTCFTLPANATPLDRLAAAIERQTAVLERIALVIEDRPGSLSPIIEMVGGWIDSGLGNISTSIDEASKRKPAARASKKPKTGGRP